MPAGGGAIATVGAEIYPDPPLTLIAVTTPPARTAVAVAGVVKPPPVSVTAGTVV